jgi:hypothetical protein
MSIAADTPGSSSSSVGAACLFDRSRKELSDRERPLSTTLSRDCLRAANSARSWSAAVLCRFLADRWLPTVEHNRLSIRT